MDMTSTAENLSEQHEPHWVSRAAFPVVSACFFTTQAALGYAVYHGWTWLAVALVLVSSHFMHGMLIGFHEASHGMLRKSRRLNEIDGVLIGIFSFLSFSLYRAAHQTHHMHLGTEKDEELWPFVVPTISRPARILAAILELTFGLFFTPFLFFRSFLRAGSPIRAPKVRRRIWAEILLTVVVWAGVLTGVALTGTWKYLLWLYLIPASLAANLQSWRKYIEHVGLTGSTIRSATRSIIPEGWLGRLVSFTLLHEPYHGVHHQHAGLTHAELPAFAADLEPTEAEEQRPFPSYRHALVHLLESLADPRVGPQWRAGKT
jgi:fatty acid desaturase